MESARATLAATVPSLVTPFEKLPSDTVQQVRARSLDVWLPRLQVITLVILVIVGASYDQPLASGEFPWKFVMLGGVLLAALQIALLFSLTKQGAVRMQGVLLAFVGSIICTYTTMPALLSFPQFMTASVSLRAQRGNPWLRLIDDGSPRPAASR